MTVTITEIAPDTINALETLARQNGQTLEEYARLILERETSAADGVRKTADASKIETFENWMNSIAERDTPGLTDEQISRESIYEEQTLRQL